MRRLILRVAPAAPTAAAPLPRPSLFVVVDNRHHVAPRRRLPSSAARRRLVIRPLNHTCTHTHPFNGPFSGTTRLSRYQKDKTTLDFTEARDSEWQWHQLGHMQVCTSLQTDNHASTPPLSFLQARCPSCRPTNSVKALKANTIIPAL